MHELAGRADLIEEVSQALLSSNVFLFGLSGVGKTSVARAALRKLPKRFWVAEVPLKGVGRLDFYARCCAALELHPAGDESAAVQAALLARGEGVLLLDDVDVRELPELEVFAPTQTRLLISARQLRPLRAFRQLEVPPLDEAATRELMFSVAPTLKAAEAAELRTLCENSGGIPLLAELLASRAALLGLRNTQALAPVALEEALHEVFEGLSERARETLLMAAFQSSAVSFEDDRSEELVALRERSLIAIRSDNRFEVPLPIERWVRSKAPFPASAYAKAERSFAKSVAASARAFVEGESMQCPAGDQLLRAHAKCNPHEALFVALAHAQISDGTELLDLELERASKPTKRLRLVVAKAEVMRRKGNYRGAIELIKPTLEANPRADRVVRADANQLLGRLHLVLSERELSEKYLQQALKASRPGERSRARAQRDLADLNADSTLGAEALEEARKTEDRELIAFAHWSMGRHLRNDGRLDEALAQLERGQSIAEELHRRYLSALIEQTRAHTLSIFGRHEKAAQSFDKALREFEALGNLSIAIHCRVGLSIAQLGMGRIEAAQTSLLEALVDGPSNADTIRAFVAATYLFANDLDKAFESLPREADSHEAIVVTEAVRRIATGQAFELESIDQKKLSPASLKLLNLIAKPPEGGVDAPTLELGEFGVFLDREALDLSDTALRILKRLAEAHAHQPGAMVRSETLIAAGWPGEKMALRSAKIRLRNAISKMRAMGLRPLLLTQTGGYLLAPSARMRFNES